MLAVRLVWCAYLVLSCGAVALSTVGSYGVRAATVLVAAALLLRAARRGGSFARARRLLALALLVGAASGAGAAVQAMATGQGAPLGNWTDFLQLTYVPFAVAGVVLVAPSAGERLRTMGDAMVAAGSLWYLTVALLVDPHRVGTGLGSAARLVTMGYLLGPPLVVAVLLSVLPGTSGTSRSFLVRVNVGMVLVSVADLCFAIAAWDRAYDAASPIAALHQAGLAVLLYVAAMADAEGPPAPRVPQPKREAAESLLPFVPLAAALSVAMVGYLRGGGFTRGQTLPLLVIGVAAILRHAAAVYAHARLVDDLQERERVARAESLQDPLTGLANRKGFVDQLAALLGAPSARPVGVAVFDLDDFKHVNDNHGHETGDRLLRACAGRVQRSLPAGSHLARLGGDEFAICAPRVTTGEALVASITGAFDAPFVVGRRHFTVRPSIGVVMDERLPGRTTPDDGSHLLAHADVAMYQAKAGKATRSVPAVILTGAAREAATNLIRMREEISDPVLEQFTVLYQPIVDLGTGSLTGVEALLRWRHPTFGELGPAQFIPLAEQVGTVATLGRHVLTIALADLTRWNEFTPEPRLTVGVNLSPPELADPELGAGVLELVRSSGVRSQQLVLEITEGALMTNFGTAVQTVSLLRDGGISVAVDDFGTGHSSLGYLRRFDADVIKIDREFVTSVSSDQRTATLVRLVVDMATELGLHTVAEGIENREQLRVVRELGCRAGQGFLFDGPLVAEAIQQLLVDGHRYQLDGGTAERGAGRPMRPTVHIPDRPIDLLTGIRTGTTPS